MGDLEFYKTSNKGESKPFLNGINTSNIRLGGNWLRESGFHPGGRVKVLALKGMLVICPEQ